MNITDKNSKKQNKPKHKPKSEQVNADELTAQLEELQGERDRYLSGWQRAQADYQNLQKESAESRERLATYIKSEVLKDFFPIIDHYYMAVAHIPEDAKQASWVQGFIHLRQQFERVLADMNVTAMDTVGKQFDVTTMEAIGTEKSETHKSGTVIREMRSGYMLGDEVIAVAKVVVAE